MYETYVPIRVERKPPTIAEIVRQKTDDGARIIDFFLDVMEGRVEDAQLCHRIDAAKQLVKYGYKKAADFIAEHGDEPCDHCESRKRGPRPRKDQGPAAGPLQSSPPHAPGPYGYDFLTMLTEDFLTVLSAVDEDLMIKLLRAQTRDGGTVIDFLDNVMHGREDGFKVNHRISAARELISHILRDEHAFAHAVLDNVGPVLSTVEGADPRVRLLPGSETPSPSILTPSPSTGEGWGEGDSPARGSVGAGLKPALPGRGVGTLQPRIHRSRPNCRRSCEGRACPAPDTGAALRRISRPRPRRQRGRPNRRSGGEPAPYSIRSGNPGRRRDREGQGRKPRTRGPHPRRAEGRAKARGAPARARPPGRTPRPHKPGTLASLVAAARPHN